MGYGELAIESKFVKLLKNKTKNEEQHTVSIKDVNDLLSMLECLEYACDWRSLFLNEKALIVSCLRSHDNLDVRRMVIEVLETKK